MNIKELKSILKENNIDFYTYWDKKRLVSLANEHNLLPKTEIDKEKSEDVNYDRLKTINSILTTNYITSYGILTQWFCYVVNIFKCFFSIKNHH